MPPLARILLLQVRPRLLNFLRQPDRIWSLSLGCCGLLWYLLPLHRAALGVLLLLHIPVLAAGILSLRLRFFCNARCACAVDRTHLALTFDDGPDPLLTPFILDVLDSHRFVGTFFCIARRVEQFPDLAREIVARGHTIACHDLDHRVTANFRMKKKLVADIRAACTTIAAVTGKHPRLYRPPVGLSNPHFRAALRELDMECIGWSRSLGDAGNRFVKKLERMPDLVHPGSVIMLHDCLPYPDSRDLFLRHFRALCEKIDAANLSSVSIGGLFGIGEYRE
jgi:peptidoglycan-N-acetylglucosamine deacetylase